MVPLRKENHEATYGAGGLNYVGSVINMMEIIKQTNYCDNPERFKEELDESSLAII